MLSTSLLLTAVALSANEPVNLASAGIQATAEHRALAASLDTTLALRMRESGWVRVTTERDVAAVLGLERQQQLLGCSDTSCMAELAGALNSRALVTGELARVGALFQLSIKVIDAQTAGVVFAALEREESDQALLLAVDKLAAAAAEAVARHYGLVAPRPSVLPLIGMVGGGIVAAGGGVLLGLSALDRDALVAQSPPTRDAALALKSAGELKQAVGLALVGVGAAVGLGALVWQLKTGAQQQPRISISATPQGVIAWGQFE